MAQILIADDDRDLCLLIREMLHFANADYDLAQAYDGPSALVYAQRHKPDLILMDIMMPGINGIDICRQLKSSPDTQYIPIIFVTALKESVDKIKAVEAGGDDFLTKPFDPIELTLRVKSLLRIKQLHDELQSRYDELQRISQWKDDLTHMIVHDMRTPLASTQLGLQFVLDDNPQLADAYRQTLAVAFSSVVQLNKMVNNLLDISRMEQGKLTLHLQPITLRKIVQAKIAELQPLAQVDNKGFALALPDNLPTLQADPEMLARVLGNLLDNAVYHARANSMITVAARVVAARVVAAHAVAPQQIEISVHNQGKPIPPQYHEAIFEKFRQVGNDGNHKGVGLGLTFCRMAVQAHGGRIWVQSTPEQGTTFIFTLPLQSTKKGLSDDSPTN